MGWAPRAGDLGRQAGFWLAAAGLGQSSIVHGPAVAYSVCLWGPQAGTIACCRAHAFPGAGHRLHSRCCCSWEENIWSDVFRGARVTDVSQHSRPPQAGLPGSQTGLCERVREFWHGLLSPENDRPPSCYTSWTQPRVPFPVFCTGPTDVPGAVTPHVALASSESEQWPVLPRGPTCPLPAGSTTTPLVPEARLGAKTGGKQQTDGPRLPVER